MHGAKADSETERVACKPGIVMPLRMMLCLFVLCLAAVSHAETTGIEPDVQVRQAAEGGDRQAQLALAASYRLSGRNTLEDHAQAVRWYERAEAQGSVEAAYWLGVMYEYFAGQQNIDLAIRWYRKAAEHGHASAQGALGRWYEWGAPTLAAEPARAAYWYRRAAEQGKVDAAVGLAGICLRGGADVGCDIGQAVHWCRVAAENGNWDAQYALGCFYARGEGVAQDHVEAAHWYRQAASGGALLEAQLALARLYLQGQGVSRDYEQAAFWFRNAAGLAEDLGESAPDPEAERQLERICREHRVPACIWRGPIPSPYMPIWYGYFGLPETADDPDSIAAVAHRDNAYAQLCMAHRHHYGVLAEQDYAQALHWYRRAALAGEPAAQYGLGSAFRYGYGTPPDAAEAAAWFLKAAERGEWNAQYELGWQYESGEGLSRDYARAAHWYARAAGLTADASASQGFNPHAREALRSLCARYPASECDLLEQAAP
ncbi:MAG: hypothetical protein LBL59_04260 [Xanthomonadaceae bacterium]|nr:hypothetical protein [Xanthomonadaceae bacterium]